MSHRDRPFHCERNPGVLARVGQGVNLAVERFVTVAETIADDNLEVKQDMYEACKEARVAGECTFLLHAQFHLFDLQSRLSSFSCVLSWRREKRYGF